MKTAYQSWPDLEARVEGQVFAKRVQHGAVALARQRDRALDAVVGHRTRDHEVQPCRDETPRVFGLALGVKRRAQRAQRQPALGKHLDDIGRHAAGQCGDERLHGGGCCGAVAVERKVLRTRVSGEPKLAGPLELDFNGGWGQFPPLQAESAPEGSRASLPSITFVTLPFLSMTN